MTRRALLAALGATFLAPSLRCFAQPQRAKIARIGLLEPVSITPAWRDALIAGLRDRGYVEGRNIIVDYRGAGGNYEILPRLAAEITRMKVDLVVAASAPAIQALQQATTTVPIVMLRT